jgi:hypothetical protein
MARYFTWEQASRLLPEVGRLLEAAVQARASYGEAETALSELKKRIETMGGVSVDRNSVLVIQESRTAAVRSLENSLQAIAELGVQVKDLDTGLVDFPTLYRGGEALLCWRLGEAGIGFWHGVEDGFRGRQRIDAEFLDRHRGSGDH